MKSHAEEYAKWVLDPANAVRTGRLIKLAAQRFFRDLQRDDIYLDVEEGNRGINFGERYCRLWEDKWRGKEMLFLPWMKFVFEQMHGWMRRDGRRRFTSVFVEVAKKNAKTTVAGVGGSFHLFADERVQTPKIFVGANNEEQAKLCVNITGKIIEQSPALYEYVEDGTVDLFKYKENIINIVHKDRDGFIKALSKEGSDKSSKTSGGKHGLNPSMGIIDEYAMASDDNLFNTLESAQAARDEPLIFCITTAGFNMDGPCYTKLRRSGIGVLEGTMVDDAYLPLIWEMDQPEGGATIDWLLANEDTWEQSNPSIDVSVSRDFLRRRLQAAKNEGGTKEVDVKTLNFNLWVDSEDTFISADRWNTNSHGLTLDDLAGEECYGGIELVGAKYLNAFCLLFPNVKGYKVIRPIFWMPDDIKREYEHYEAWIKEGYIKSFLGNVSDNDLVLEMLLQEIGKYYMRSFAFKTNLENSDIVQGLIKKGIVGNPISHGIQGISTPTLAWEEMILRGEAEHFNNPVLRWMNANCTAKRKEGDIRLVKQDSKVVGIYAAINALAQWKSVEAEGGGTLDIVII